MEAAPTTASVVYTLLLRMLYVDPRAADKVIMHVLNNLRSPKPHVLSASQETVTSLYPYAEEHRQEILTCLFNTGHPGAMPVLKEILVGETMQHGRFSFR